MLKKWTAMVFIVLAIALFVKAQDHPIKADTSESPALILGQTVEKEISPMQKHIYKFHLEAGQFAKFEVAQKGADVVLTVATSDNKNLVELKNPVEGLEGIEEISIAVETKGDYELRIISFSEKTGAYSAKFSELRQATEKEINFTSGWKLQNEGIKIKTLSPKADAIAQALERFEKAAEKFKAAEAKRDYSAALTSIASQYQLLGKRQKAIEFFQIALQDYRASGKRTAEPIILNSLGSTYSNLGNWQKAIEYYGESLSISNEIDQTPGFDKPLMQAIALGEIGLIYEKIGDLEKAENYYLQGLEKIRQTNVLSDQSAALNNLGRISFYQTNYPKALGYFQEALTLSQKSNDQRGQASIFSNLGKTFSALGEKEKGIQLLNQALEISRSRGEKLIEAYFLQQLGKTYFLNGESNQAEEFLLKSLEIYRQIEDPTNLAETLFSLAKVEKKIGKLEESQKYYEEGLKLIESFRSIINSNELRESFSTTIYDNYSFYAELLMQRHTQEPNKDFAKQAWLASERGRARGLLNLLNESNANIYEGVEKDLLEKERGTYNLLNARLENLTKILRGKNNPKQIEVLRQEIDAIKTDYQLVQAKIRENNPHYAALTQPRAVSIEETQNQLLDENSALLSYSLGAEKSYLWFVTKEKWQVFELPKREVIETKAKQNYMLLTARNAKIKFETAEEKQNRINQADKDLSQVSKDLSQILLAPVENLLGNKKLLIVADGALQYIPFASLKNKNRYLIETNEIINLPSTSTLGILRRDLQTKKIPSKTAIVLADPVFDVRDERFSLAKSKGNSPNPVATRNVEFEDVNRAIKDLDEGEPGIPRLPFTRKEAETIAKYTSNNQTKIALDFASTKQLALSEELKDYRIIHFATHGLLNSKNPELSGLVFSLIDENGNPLNGFLRTDEVFNMKLSADLVVLSGCKTGLGKEVRGEGLIGLTRGFMYAGALRLMVSLWDVNDEATAQLMSYFYQNLLSKKMKPAQALREAQLSFLKDKRFSNPYFAMAFTLYGDF